MSVITFCAFSNQSGFTACSFQLVSNTQTFQSPMNKQVQTLELPGARWCLSATLLLVNRTDWSAFIAFLAAMRGSANRFMIGDRSHTAPINTITGTMTVNGASQVGASLVTTGWTGTMKAGDYVQFVTTASPLVTELRMVTADATNSGGSQTLYIDSPMRNHPVNGSTIILTNTQCKMILVDDNQAKWEKRDGIFQPIQMSAVEVFE